MRGGNKVGPLVPKRPPIFEVEDGCLGISSPTIFTRRTRLRRDYARHAKSPTISRRRTEPVDWTQAKPLTPICFVVWLINMVGPLVPKRPQSFGVENGCLGISSPSINALRINEKVGRILLRQATARPVVSILR